MNYEDKTKEQIIEELMVVSRELSAVQNSLNDKTKAIDKLEFDLRERIKELHCHGKISEIFNDYTLSIDEVFQQVCDHLPAAFQFPDSTGACIELHSKKYHTPRYNSALPSLKQDILIRNHKIGVIEVTCGSGAASNGNSAFLIEEANLLYFIALRLGGYADKAEKGMDLVNSKTLYHCILEASPDLITITDMEGNITFTSSKVITMFGSEHTGDFINQPLLKFVHPADHERAINGLRLMMEGVFTGAEEYKGVRLNDTQFDMEVNGSFIRNERGEPIKMVFITRDITARKKIESALKQSENRYRSLVNNQTNYLIKTDLKGRYTFWNQKFEEEFGWVYDEKIAGGESLLSICPYHHQRTIEIVEKCLLQPGAIFQVELDKMVRNGEIKSILWEFVAVLDESGYPEGVQCIGVDITVLKKSENALKESEEKISEQNVKFNAILNVMPDLIFVHDKDGNYREFYCSTPELLLTPPDQIIGKNLRDIFEPVEAEMHHLKIRECVETGKLVTYEYITKTQAVENFWEARLVPMGSDKILSLIRDVTEKRVKDNEIRDLNQNLEQKVELATVELKKTNEELLREIDERILVEAALQAKTEELENFFNVALDLLSIADHSDHFLKLNKVWEETLGYTIDELKSTGFLHFIHPEDREGTKEAIADLRDGKSSRCYTNRFRTKDGSYRFIEWRSVPVGEKVYSSARDITQNKRAHDFENEMLELSSSLTGIAFTEIDSALKMMLERIGNFLAADRTYIFEINDFEGTMSNTFEWCNKGIQAEIENLQGAPIDIFPNWMTKLRKQENIIIPVVAELPESWTPEREALEPQGIQSLLVIPLVLDGKLIGFVGLDSVLHPREYSEAEINTLKVWSSMISSLINKKRTEGLLEQTRQNFETFFNTIDDFLWVLDIKGNIVHTNNTVISRLGYTREELVDRSVLMVHPVDRRNEANRIVGEMLAGKAEFCPVPVVTKSGKQIPVETRVKIGFWDSQPVIFGVSKDISQLQLSEQKFSKAFQSNSAMMAISNFENGAYIDVNNELLEIMGYEREDLIGSSDKDLNLFVDRNFRNEIIENLKQNLPIRKREIQMRTKDGTIKTGLLSADSIYIGKTRCLFTVTMDISNRKKAEEELVKARIEAEHANMAKSEFLSRMSHELRTPMNSILGFAQLLDMGELKPTQKKNVSQIIRSGKHLLDLINEVLDITRIEAGRMSLSLEPVQVNGIIQEMMDTYVPLAKDQDILITLVHSPDNLLHVKADRQRLRQILLNLISNAVKYNRLAGSVIIKAEKQAQNEVGIIPMRISFTDTGPGIAPEAIAKLFVPFERIGAERTKTQGSGLGLSVVKKLVNAMGGIVGVESEVGEGSTFWIELPVSDSPLDGVKNLGLLPSPVQASQTSGKVLYIEDNASNVELVQEILLLQRSQISLLFTTTGLNAVEIAIQHKPNLILLDLNLPDIHGSKVIKMLKKEQRTKSIPVVIISADATPQQVERLLLTGAERYLTKPLDVGEFLRVVDQVIKP